MSKEIRDAIETLKTAIHEDSEYAWSWQCNLAMAAYDEGLDHSAANRSAARFMQNLFDIDMTKYEYFKETQENCLLTS